MALIDELEQKYGLSGSARSNISNIQSQTGGDLLGSIESKYGISSGSLIDNIESKYGLGGKPKVQQQVQQQTVPAYTGQIESDSPLSFGQRAGLSTAGSAEAKKSILEQMGFETLQDQQGNLLVKQGDKVFPVDEKGFSIGDIADFVGGQLPIVGERIWKCKWITTKIGTRIRFWRRTQKG